MPATSRMLQLKYMPLDLNTIPRPWHPLNIDFTLSWICWCKHCQNESMLASANIWFQHRAFVGVSVAEHTIYKKGVALVLGFQCLRPPDQWARSATISKPTQALISQTQKLSMVQRSRIVLKHSHRNSFGKLRVGVLWDRVHKQCAEVGWFLAKLESQFLQHELV